MKKNNENKVLANVISRIAKNTLSNAASSRCAFVYHQPKQPEEVKQFRKF